MIYSFTADDSDHCETPFEAYQDIEIFLEKLATEQLKSKKTIRIYDPYYCEGAAIFNLNKLGFMNVYNVNEDFYSQFSETHYIGPDFDVIVTNPPYSQDHMEKLVIFCIQSLKPFFLLLPSFVYTKEYYIKNVLERKLLQTMLFYLVPIKRYKYATPKGRRQLKSKAYTSPFNSFWYCSLRRYTDKVLDSCDKAHTDSLNCSIIRSINSLPIQVTAENDVRNKKLRNSQKRRKHKARKKAKTN